MRTLSTILWICAALGVAGCGEVTLAEPDAGPPGVQSVNVDDGATRVSVLTPLDAVVSHALDPATVDSAVTVTDEYGNEVPGELGYDEITGTVSFRPLAPLAYGTTYTWQLTGLQTAEGQSLPDAQGSFTTYVNNRLRSIGYARDTGAVNRYTRFELDGDFYAEIVSYNGSGADTQWFTDDDEIQSYNDYARDGGDRYLRTIGYQDPGDDGAWKTADDTVSYYSDYVYNEAGRTQRLVSYFAPGADALWFTADDPISLALDFKYRPDGQEESQSRLRDPGQDGLWFTADDVRDPMTRYEYDEQGWATRQVDYNNPGPDNQWNTPDDAVSGYTLITTDDNGQVILMESYTSPGQDAQWFTADDTPHQQLRTTYDAQGNRVEGKNYLPGPDGQWMTPDDILSSTIEYDTSR